MEIVTERLLNEERKQRDHKMSVSSERAIAGKQHTKWQSLLSVTVVTKLVTYNVTVLNGWSIGLVTTSQVFAVKGTLKLNHWIIDSRATCHICNDEQMLTELKPSRGHNW